MGIPTTMPVSCHIIGQVYLISRAANKAAATAVAAVVLSL